jgi:hypothetical protein
MTRHGGKLNSFVATEEPHRSSRATVALVSLAVACTIGGCRERATQTALADNAECSVIARFATEPNGALLADVERATGVELEPLGTITDDLRVYRLHGVGSEDDCKAAIERLRGDERVTSVDLDERRSLHNEQSSTQGAR